MEIAVILLNYNSVENVINCIESFKKCSSAKYKFIVVDNASKECDCSYFLENNYCFLKENSEVQSSKQNTFISLSKNYGYSYGNNVGLELAKKNGYKYAIVANPDTEVVDIESAVNIMEKNEYVALFPKAIGPAGENQSIYFDRTLFGTLLFNFLYPVYYLYIKTRKKICLLKAKKNDSISIQFSIGCFIVFDMEKFEKIGFFDDNVFLYGEEMILYQRAKKLNFAIGYSDKVSIKHNHLYKEMSEFVKNEHKKSRTYYYSKYKKYPKSIVSLINFSYDFKEKFYDKIISKIKKNKG